MKQKYKILNGYAGIGGNRKLWGDCHDITAVELDSNIANIYQKLYKNDTIIVSNMHDYLIENFMNFDFIWLSPPCPTHSRLRLALKNAITYADMSLYQQIILLSNFYKGKWVVENVKPYYQPLIKPTFEIDRHYFWSNCNIPKIELDTNWRTGKVKDERKLLEQKFGFDLSLYGGINKRKALRNCVIPELGLHILNSALTPSV